MGLRPPARRVEHLRRDVPRGVRPGQARRRGRHRGQPERVAEERVDLARRRSGVSSPSRTTTAAPPSAIQRALAVWWSAAAWG
jgi:hypothetical protein